MAVRTGWDDTIVALSTPPGISAIAVIRLSGTKALEIVNDLFTGKDISARPTHTLHVGFLEAEGEVLDEVVVSLFRHPHSYTGEDVVEISCHGSAFVQDRIIAACIRLGARVARPGEFTQRAFLNGKLDLAQAEAVADLIASNTRASRNTALNNMRGGFSVILKNLREELLKFSALIELELDFSQEDVEFADRKQLYELVSEADVTTKRLMESFRLGNVIKNGVQVAIIGRPNAGKSTLLNALLNESRALVSEIAGTTRDTVEEVLNIDGILFRLIDTAGIRDHSTDAIEMMGMERSRAKMKEADIVVCLFDASAESSEVVMGFAKEMQEGGVNHLLVGNKADLVPSTEQFAVVPGVIFVSAREGWHVDELKKRLYDNVIQGSVETESAIVTNARHYEALAEVSKSLYDIRNGLDNRLPGDLIALDIRRGLHYLGEITGDITTEDQLDYIFSKFCIGK